MFKLKAHSLFGSWSPNYKAFVYAELHFSCGFFHFVLDNFPLNCLQLVCVCVCVHIPVHILRKEKKKKKEFCSDLFCE